MAEVQEAKVQETREKLLELRNVTTHYGPIRVLHDVDMVIYPGEMVCLLGGNASGKSTDHAQNDSRNCARLGR